jgi:mono/diheme cytochrome c family protein
MRSATRLSFLVNCCTNCTHRYHADCHFPGPDAHICVPVYHARWPQSTGCELVHTASAFPREDFQISRSRRLSWAPVTEIPEHLLKRSKAARAQAEGAPAAPEAAATPGTAAATTSATTPAVPAAAAPPAAPAGPPPPKPDIPVVAAAKARKKIPFWAFATLSTLPLWAFMYVRALTPAAERIAGPLGDGATEFTGGCASCHGSKGEGGVGYQFSQGEVLKTFPRIEDQLRWVYAGTDAYVTAGVDIYGDPKRAGGPHVARAKGTMPQQGEKYGGGLTDAQILAVVCHERFTLGGADPLGANETEFTNWCAEDSPAWTALEDGSATFEDIDTKVPGAIKVGTDPVAGSSAGS